MNVLLAGDFDTGEAATWRAALAAALPEARWWSRADVDAGRIAAADIAAAVVANPPPGSLQGLPALRLVQSLWAGIDRLMADPTLPAGVPVARMVDPAMTAAMAETALWAVLALHRGFFAYQQRQREGLWRAHAQRRADEVPVAVLGQGEMGRAVTARLAALGYPVQGWRRDGRPLAEVLARSEIVVNLLPLTPATRGVLDARAFAAMPAKSALVNLGRGAHVVDADLLAALDSGHLRHAVLDVFTTEPLPAGHPYWTHPRVTMLPHAAAATDPRSAAAVAAANLRAARDGAPVAHLVERTRGY
ncbi:MAG: glyoxylate/hydroxypyruvate reductase A [Rubrivivax sp.]|nr:glyoxylate/hydroxypyruvate reductase A [Rubrivivax sp.]